MTNSWKHLKKHLAFLYFFFFFIKNNTSASDINRKRKNVKSSSFGAWTKAINVFTSKCSIFQPLLKNPKCAFAEQTGFSFFSTGKLNLTRNTTNRQQICTEENTRVSHMKSTFSLDPYDTATSAYSITNLTVLTLKRLVSCLRFQTLYNPVS